MSLAIPALIVGRPAADRARVDQHERHVRLAESGIFRPAGNGAPWRPRFGT